MDKICSVVKLVGLVLLSTLCVAANASPGGVDPTALKLWLDSSDIDGDGSNANDPAHGTGVATWVDKSGNGNDATPLSGQATFDSDTAQLINGLPAVRFSNSPYNTGLDLRPVTTPDATVFTVYVQKTSDDRQAPWGIDNNGWDRFFYSSHPGFGDVDDGVVGGRLGGTTIPDAGKLNETYLLTATFLHEVTNGSSVYFDGEKIAEFTDLTDATDQIIGFRLGYDGDDGMFNGQLAEVLVYDRALTDCERQVVYNYLGVKYGKNFGEYDLDGDGVVNCLDLDVDGDGISNAVEGTIDTDNDGVADYIDLDSDDDGISDFDEGLIDIDGDGSPNYLDLDSDGDGLSDAFEGTADIDGDGTANVFDGDDFSLYDFDNDGLNNASESCAVLPFSLMEVTVAGTTPTAVLVDGAEQASIEFRLNGAASGKSSVLGDRFFIVSEQNNYNGDYSFTFSKPIFDAELFFDGVISPSVFGNITVELFDGSVLSNVDFDIIPDTISAEQMLGVFGPTTNRTTRAFVKDSSSGTHTMVAGTPNGSLLYNQSAARIRFPSSRLQNFDGVGIKSITVERINGSSENYSAQISVAARFVSGTDTDNDGLLDCIEADSDADGISDSVEGAADTDSDGIPNFIDTDSDDDGISDAIEGVVDTDGDTAPNYIDVDSDGDGILDSIETTVDTDSDGSPNYIDLDSDADGITDSVEATADIDNDGVANYLDLDSDADGISDALEGVVDTDNDGVSNYLDTDSDGDAISDLVEGATDTDGDLVPDYLDPNSLVLNAAVWFRADSGVIDSGSGVSQWEDNSAHATDVTRTPSASVSLDSNSPYFNFNPAVDFDGTPGSRLSGIAPLVPTGAQSFIVVSRYTGDGFLEGVISYGSKSLVAGNGTYGIDGDSVIGARSASNALNVSQITSGFYTQDNILNSSLYTNGSLSETYTGSSINSTPTTQLEIGGRTLGGLNSRVFEGQIAEVIHITGDISGTQAQATLESYLATKYGVTLDQTVATNYLDSEQSVVWSAAANTGYNHDVFGIGRDDLADLDQRVSRSTNSSGIVTIALDVNFLAGNQDVVRARTHANDKQYLYVSNNGGVTTTMGAELPANVPLLGNVRVAREWRISKTVNFSAPVSLKFDGFDDQYYLVVDSDSDFTNGASVVGRLGSTGEIANATLADGQFMTLVKGLDTDGDGISDVVDSDDDADGIDDSIEGTTDIDNDGLPNYLDTDSDNDGILDALEGSVDTDDDGVANYLDSDSDGDTIPDATEGSSDTDADGIADYIDTDSDDDGLGDAAEGGVDTDNDGVANYLDTDSDADGIADHIEGAIDSDNDGAPNYVDLDADGDGAVDSVEGVIDTDGDAIPNYLDLDSDGDGISDANEGTNDAEGDGIANYVDTDSDGDGHGDAGEGAVDTDGDGIADYLDTDSDNDGIPDMLEAAADTDSDGLLDYRDTDSDNDGIADSVEGLIDTDNDGSEDYLDLDSDSDGIPDSLEGDIDTDLDGLPDYRDTDSDNDGIDDRIEGAGDSDQDGIPDSIDTDSNGDGIPDAVLGTGDKDGDGIADYLDGDIDGDGIANATEGSVVPVEDTDNDGIPNYADTDSDNDGISDNAEGVSDSDGDGLVDSRDTDSDNDGLADSIEGLMDSDNDGVADYLDADSDSDGIADAVEGGGDTDADSIPDYLDTDSDNDGISDAREGVVDTDGDGAPNFVDTDSDADGMSDGVETTRDQDSDGIPNYLDADSDGDGIPDRVEGATDSDGDGIPDAQDVDANGDGIPDAALSDGDLDGDGIPDYLDGDIDGDGIANGSEGGLDQAEDSDSDGTPNYRDTDSDNDGIPDSEEGTGDADGDGILNAFDVDSDNDGIPDGQEGSHDTDSDGLANYLDSDSDGDGIPDMIEGVVDTDSDGMVDSLDNDANNDGIEDIFLGSNDLDGDGSLDYLDSDIDGDGVSNSDELLGFAIIDIDGDGIPNYLDTDSDNDGIADALEPRGDSDGDGIPDFADTDSDGDSLLDRTEGSVDTDRDGRSNYLDLDSDNDGIPDSVEGALDSDSDGISDTRDSDTSGLNGGRLLNDDVAENALQILLDTDADGYADYLDLDSDSDGLPDLLEAGGSDVDGDGQIDLFQDTNRDGLDDGLAVVPLNRTDTDTDGYPDHLDLDSDNDGISDIRESNQAFLDDDGDGRVDNLSDSNGDGWVDNAPTVITVDTDSDGIPDHHEIDSDDDGLSDLIEAGGTDKNGDGIADGWEDADADGIPDSVDVDQAGGGDADNDGIANFADADFLNELDADNDGIIDRLDIDPFGDGFARLSSGQPLLGNALPDTDGDGTPDVNEAIAGQGFIRTGISGRGGALGPLGLVLLSVSVFLMAIRRRRENVLKHKSLVWGGLVAVWISTGCSSLQPVASEQSVIESASDFKPHIYIAGGVGVSRLKPDTSEVLTHDVDDAMDLGRQLTLGVDVNQRLSLEVHSAEFGSAGLSPEGRINYHDHGASALIYVGRSEHLVKRIGLMGYGRVGGGVMENSAKGEVPYRRTNTQHIHLGAGLEYMTKTGLGLRAEVTSYDKDVLYSQLALLYRFGKRHSAKVGSSLVETITADGAAAIDTSASIMATNNRPVVETCKLKLPLAVVAQYGSDSSVATAQSLALIEPIVEQLVNCSSIPVVLIGHTDSTGRADYNLALSERRIASLKAYLSKAGISLNRMSEFALGETRPIAPNTTAEGRRLNRRVEIQLQ